ncbi:MAG: cation-translocating P-type ATPase [Elusimicrobia bacterium]|nr:cation-translocating P-type ATPase [Elusimicrobiota bacterium]
MQDLNELLTSVKGLSQATAVARLKRDGYNELPAQKKRNIFTIALSVLKEPMLLLLVASGSIYFLLGEAKDGFMLMAFVFVVIGITLYHERKTENALDALRNLSSPRALVIRDGKQMRIPGREVVKDDIMFLKEGDRVPADAVVLAQSNMSADESLLTGESAPVRKLGWDGKTAAARPGGDDLPFVYCGSLIVSGRGLAQVTAVGLNSEMGKIGKALTAIEQEETPLNKETGKIVKNFAIAGIILCAVVIVVFGITRGSWLNGFLAGLTLSMAMLPEEFPVVLVIFLALGAWRISKKNVLTRRTQAIETMGATTVLCTDKTGTLTHNSMRLCEIWAEGNFHKLSGAQIPEPFHNLLEYSILASQENPFDPIEKELKSVGQSCLYGTEHIHQNWKIVREYPLSKELLSLSHVWRSPDDKSFIIGSKGAPESVIDLCHLNEGAQKEIMSAVAQMSERGIRVLATACARFEQENLPPLQHDFDFKFAGLIGFMDPVRSSVPHSIKEAHAAGIRVIMITGDYPGTAGFIARQIGLKNPQNIITGPELAGMGEERLQKRIKETCVFARIMPEQKLAIVNALKSNGEIVAMTGDGVNDAPALKSAHIGIAMGERGTDVAREASSIVLMDDDFSSIVHAIRLGRRIFDNLKKAMSFILSVHVPIAGMSLIPVLFGLPIMLLPAHIAFLELIIDPSCSIVFEAEREDKGIMSRPPRRIGEPLFSRRMVVISLLQGLSVLAAVLGIFLWSIKTGKPEAETRALAFSALVFANIMLILTNLSWKENFAAILRRAHQTFWWISAGAVSVLLLALYAPFLRNLFHFAALHPHDLAFSFAIGAISLSWFEIYKAVKSS